MRQGTSLGEKQQVSGEKWTVLSGVLQLKALGSVTAEETRAWGFGDHTQKEDLISNVE